jgi:oligoendopeptidase F
MKRMLFSALALAMICNVSVGQTTPKVDVKDPAYCWDFTHIYSSWDAWQQELKKYSELTPKFLEYKGKISKDPQALLGYLKLSEQAGLIGTKLYCYVSLQHDVDGKNSIYRTKQQEFENISIEMSNSQSWFASELATLPQETCNKWLNEVSGLAIYRHSMESFYRERAHILDEKTQNVINQYSRTLGSPLNIYNSLAISDIEFPKVTLSTGEVVTASPAMTSRIYATSPSQEDRLKVANANREYYYKNRNTFADIYLTKIQTSVAGAKLSGYESCLEATLSSDNIPKDVYSTLLRVTQSNVAPLQKYWDLRKKALGLTKYYSSDAAAELVNFSRTYKWDEGVNIVSSALQFMGKEYYDTFKQMLVPGRIDVYEKPGKQTGAYNLPLYGVHPYVLMNWNETRDNVFTLAHELGHSVHGILSQQYQPFIYSDANSMVAEVASTFNECVLLDYLLAQAKDPNEKISLLIQAIDNIAGTYYRQVQFADFEYTMHNMVEHDQPLNADIMAKVYGEIDAKYNGPGVEQPENLKYSWPRVMHFFNYNFYVYNYAVSFTASNALYSSIAKAKNKKEADAAKERYMTLLKSGGNDYPINLLKKAGIDMTKEESYLTVTSRMQQLVDQLEKELKAIGNI